MCSYLAHLWATSDCAPRSEAVGTPQAAGDDHPNAPTETVAPPPCSNITLPSQTRMVNTRPVCGDGVLAALYHALTNGPGTPTAQLQHVQSLLRDEWERPLDVIIPSSGSQQYTQEARHLRDVYSKSYVTDSAEIVVYCSWLTRTALSADWDVMGVAWVVCDSLWNGSFVPLGRRLVLAESWALCILKAASIDMVYAPPLLAAQIYDLRNEHWVLRLLFVSPTHTFLCLVFDPLCNKPIVNLIAEREGIQARPQKRWDKFLGEFGSVAFGHGGAVSSVRLCDSPPPPPPPPCPPGPLSYQGAIATGHTYGGAEGAQNFFFIPLAHVASLPAQAVKHPNAILEPNLDSNAHPNPQPAPDPAPNPSDDPNPNPNPNQE